VVAITTMPALPRATLRIGGTTVTTDGAGATTIQVASFEEGSLPLLTVIDDGIAAPDRQARFSRWWGLGGGGGTVKVVAVFDLFREVTWRYVEQSGAPVDPALVTALVIRSSHGNVHRLGAPVPLWLHATRAVPTIGGLVPKDIDYRVESVLIDGGEVVIRNQQKFVPATNGSWTIQLLFFNLRFTARDALLGVPTGDAIVLESPSGRRQRYPVDAAGELRLRLPRGTYKAMVDVGGMRVWTPVSLSRDQEAPLKVLTYLDMSIVGGCIGVVALGLLLVGRPHLLQLRARRPRMVRAQDATRTPCAGGCPPASRSARFCRFCGTPRALNQPSALAPLAQRERT
jgi:hypothetical protein